MLKRFVAETNYKAKDRIILVIRVIRDMMTIKDAAKSLGKSQSWGYKWWGRYNIVGIDKLYDLPRSGRPPNVYKVNMQKIKKGACQKLIWTGKPMRNYIKKRTEVKYILGHTCVLLRSWGYSQKVPVGKHVRRAPDEEISEFRKNIANKIEECDSKGVIVAIQDEAIVTADARPRKQGYTKKRVRARYTYTGAHSKKLVFGLLTTDGRGMFRQYEKFNQDSFADYLKQAVRKFKKIDVIPEYIFRSGFCIATNMYCFTYIRA